MYKVLYLMLALLSIPAWGQNAKTIDLTSRADNNKYFVVICGRNNTASGHAFIVWGKEDSNQRMSTVDGAFGFYMTATDGSFSDAARFTKSFFTPVPGELVSEFYPKTSLSQDLLRLIVQVDKSVYDKSLEIEKRWESRTDYQAIENDCITFAAEVAKELGVNVPHRALTDKPWSYVGKFLELNNQADYLSGTWESQIPARRFKLEISKLTCIWTETNQSGQTFTKTVQVNKENNEYRVYRPNDSEALQYLGFQPTLRSQILARGANPSYIVIKRTDATNMQGDWNGLRVIKDASANLQTLQQPGSFPATIYSFKRMY